MKYTAEQYLSVKRNTTGGCFLTKYEADQLGEMMEQAAALLREQALQGLADQAQELGLGYGEQTKGAQGEAVASPENCRNRLQQQGKAYPRSGCAVCKTGGLTGCPYEKAVHGDTAPRAAVPTFSGLDLAVIGAKHFGNPIPKAWYAAARELLSAAPSDGGEQGERP